VLRVVVVRVEAFAALKSIFKIARGPKQNFVNGVVAFDVPDFASRHWPAVK